MPQRVFTKLGWSRVPVGEWDQAAFWVTNYAGALKSYLKRQMPPLVSRLVGSCLYLPLLLTDIISRRKRDFKIDYQIGWCTGFDERFDRFWTEFLESRSDLFLASRTRNTMDWHFRGALERNDAWILTASKGTRLVGYAILQRKDSPAAGLSRMMLVDFQTLDKDPALSSAMIFRALERCRRERIYVLENQGCWIEKLQPIVNPPSNHRALDSWCYLYKSARLELTQALQTAAAWYPTQYDGDASL